MASPYAAPANGTSAAPESPESVLVNREYLGFWQRVVASLIDNVAITVIGLPLGFSLAMLLNDEKAAEHITNALSLALGAAFILTFWGLLSATPGKLIFSAKIVDAATGQSQPSASS